MVIMNVPFIILILSLCCFQYTEGLIECMSCKGIPEPHDCKETMICSEHEQCSTDFYITPQGHVFYDLGCKANRVCNALNAYGGRKRSITQKEQLEHVKRQDGNLYICEECCNNDDFCNRFGCNDLNKNKLNRTVCYSCVDVEHPSKCDTVDVCDIDKQCYARHFITDMFEERYKLGCEEKKICDLMVKNGILAGHPKRQIGGFDSIDLCYYCCDNNFCNKKECEKGTLTTLSTHAPKITTLPPKTTTHAPKITTHPPKTTTHAPKTHPPKTTTHAPRTHPPKTTTHAPITHPPKTTTHAPKTHPPKTTTHAPRTHPPKTTTHAPKTHPPKTTTHAPKTHPPKTTTHAPKTHPPKTTTHAPKTHPPKTTTHAPTTKAKPFSCYHCEFINHVRECNYTEVCQTGEDKCYLARVDGGADNENLCFYKMGCMSHSDCNSYKHQIKTNGIIKLRGTDEDIEYFDCCDGSQCNEHRIKPHPSRCIPITTIKP